MDKLLALTFKDPVLTAAAVFIVAAVAVLLWAAAKLQSLSATPNLDMAYEPDEAIPENEPEANGGLAEARLQEISSQLTEINQRITNIEKIIKDKRASDQTIQATIPPKEMEEFVNKIEAKLESVSAEKTSQSADLTKLETKLEGIHRLLILLTDSGTTEQK